MRTFNLLFSLLVAVLCSISVQKSTADDDDVEESAEVHSLEKISDNNFFSNFSVPPEIVEKAILRPHQQVYPYFKDSDEQEKYVASPAGRTVRLSCKAGGFPEPMVIWHKNDALIVQDSPRGSGSEYRIRKWSLELEDASTDDSGKYVCEIWSEIGTVNRTFHVKIISRLRSPPLIIPNVLVNQTVNVNATARFKCKVISDLSPHIAWVRVTYPDIHDLYDLQSKPHEKVNYQDLADFERATIVHDRDESTLTLEMISILDQGIYACITGNTLGMAMANATLIVNDFMDYEIPTGTVETEMTFWWMLFIAFVIVTISVLVGLCVAYVTCITYYKKKHFLENEALIGKRKKIIVTHKTHNTADFKDQPASYQVQVVEQNLPKKKGATRFRLSSEVTMLDEYEVAVDQNWEIERDRLQLQEVIGSGAFGEVWKATLKNKLDCDNEDKEIPVAVKKVKPSATEKDLVTLVQEMEMFKVIGCHENILRLIGCCSGIGPLYVLLELCEYGNLRDFLRAHRPKEEKVKTGNYTDYLEPRKACYTQKPVIENLTQRHLVQFAHQIAKAMEFMAARKIVHRDLAARNVLVAANFVMKVSDFGLSKDVKYNDYYRKKGKERLPFKWMAIETLDNQISTIESDVWSFGIVMWEVMTLGGTPYPTIAMEQLFTCLKAGYRMEAPHNCPEEIYVLMVTCWQEKRDLRPTFTMIVTYLEWMLEQAPGEGEALEDKNAQENPSYVNFNAPVAEELTEN
ncbi:unnamed protein product [Auanema sp. JU1783]|nr:unnamed protein product [Auanema sp. JU1783]